MKWFRNYRRYRKFLRRVKENLPSHHPVSKIRFDWDIKIRTRKTLELTGKVKQIGLATLKIRQVPPLAREAIKDSNVYHFSWFYKDIIPLPYRKWKLWC